MSRQTDYTPDELDALNRAFLEGVTVTYWDGEFADELLAKLFGWSV